jgi:hypothetical protein
LCAWPRSVPQRSRSFIKVKVWKLTISCPAYDFLIPWPIDLLFDNYVNFNKELVAHVTQFQTSGEYHSLRSKFEIDNSLSSYIVFFLDQLTIFFWCMYVKYHRACFRPLLPSLAELLFDVGFDIRPKLKIPEIDIYRHILYRTMFEMFFVKSQNYAPFGAKFFL